MLHKNQANGAKYSQIAPHAETTKAVAKTATAFINTCFQDTASRDRTGTNVTIQRILNPSRLPIPPWRHGWSDFRFPEDGEHTIGAF
jgi:hypothetical protein